MAASPEKIWPSVLTISTASPHQTRRRKVGGGRLNMLAVDGRSIAGTTYGERLHVLEKDTGIVVAGEPFDDDPDWIEVPEGVLVEGNEHGLTLTPLEL